MQGTTHVFRLSAPEKSESMPPHLAAAAIPAADRRLLSPVKLVAAGRARVGSFLNGGIPGSAAASAAVNLYSGTSGMAASICSSAWGMTPIMQTCELLSTPRSSMPGWPHATGQGCNLLCASQSQLGACFALAHGAMHATRISTALKVLCCWTERCILRGMVPDGRALLLCRQWPGGLDVHAQGG